MVVRVKDRPVRNVLRLIAEQVHASWVVQDNGSMLLVRRAEDIAVQQAQQRALERQGIEAIKKKIREEIGDGSYTVQDVEKFVSELEKVAKPPPQGQGMSLDGPRLAGPASLLAKSVLLSVPTDELLTVTPQTRLLLTETPNRSQRRAGPKTQAAIDQFWKNVQLFVDLKSSLLGESRGTLLDQSLIEMEMPSSGRGKTLAGVSRSGHTLHASARTYAASGDRFTDGFILGEALLPPWKVPERLRGTRPIGYSPSSDAQLLTEFVSGSIRLDGTYASDSRETRLFTLLRDPERFDLFCLRTSEMFIAWANALGTDLVANVPSSFDRTIFDRGFERGVQPLWDAIERARALRVDERDGVLLAWSVSTTNEFMASGLADRLGKLHRRLGSEVQRLDATAEFLAETFVATGDLGHGQWILMLWDAAGVIPHNWHQQGLYTLAVYHELGNRLRSQLRNGSRFFVRDLSPAARAVVNGTIGRWSWSSDAVPETHLSMHPSEHFPFGVPLVTSVDVSVEPDVNLIATVQFEASDRSPTYRSSHSLRRVAQAIAEAGDDHMHPVLYGLSQAKEISAFRVEELKLTFTAPDGTSCDLSLQIPLERPTKTTLSPKELVEKYFGGS